MRDRLLNELLDDAQALIEADHKVVKAVVESDIENLSTLISQFRDKKIKVQKGGRLALEATPET